MKYLIPLFCLFGLNLLSQPQTLTLTNFSTGYSRPLDIAHAGDGRLFIVEQGGKIWMADSNGVKSAQPFLDITNLVSAPAGEQGLLGLAFHPDYKSNGYFFVNYTDKTLGNTYVSRFKVTADPNVADPSSEDIVITIVQDFTNHNGGCIKFGDDGYLYIGMGDGGSGGDPFNRAQDPDELLGKMLRLDVDVDSGYAIPPDNPYYGSLSVRNEIWAMGMRNPWRFSFDRLTQNMWIGDVGQGAWEEIDVEPASSTGGYNWGWRCYEGLHPYNTSGCQAPSNYDPPVFDYPHDSGCSVTGGYVYRGARYKSMWGWYYFNDYCTGKTWTLRDNGSFYDTTYLGGSGFGWSTFGEDACGELYVARLNSGSIQRVGDTTCTPTAFITTEDTLSFCSNGPPQLEAWCGRGVQYEWFLDDTLSVGTTRIITPLQDGWYRVRASRGACSDLSDSVYVTIHEPPIVTLIMADTFFMNPQPDDSVALVGVPPGGTFSGTGVSGNFFHPYLDMGTYVITYQYTDSNGCSAADSQQVIVEFEGIDSHTEIPIKVFPNPAHTDLSLQLTLSFSGQVSMELLDAVGRGVMNRTEWLQAGSSSATLSVATLPSGIYSLRVQSDRERAAKTVVVSR